MPIGPTPLFAIPGITYCLNIFIARSRGIIGETLISCRMPSSLDEWLEAWTLALDNETKSEENEQFHCYDPRNYQTSWVYNELKEDESKDLETLKKRFAVSAPFDRMDTAICAIYIQFSGRVPTECVCSSKETEWKPIHDKHMRLME
ncbi:hypothetical protein ACHAXS_000209 [Conticribra weissflogii]